MANPKGFEVIVDELTVHEGVREIRHPITGEPRGWQNGNGKIYYLGEVLGEDQMSPDWWKALTTKEGTLYVSLSTKFSPVSSEPTLNEAYRLGLPFEGYSDMEEDDILAAMRVLPSAAVTRIKEWEASHGEGREKIVYFNIGYGESPTDRQEGRVNGDILDDDDLDQGKPVRSLSTRQVPDDGAVVPGEGITGTGEPAIPHGSRQVEAEEEADAPRAGRARKGRRPRAPQKGAEDQSDTAPQRSGADE